MLSWLSDQSGLHLYPQEIRLYPELCHDTADAAADRGDCAGDDQLNGKCLSLAGVFTLCRYRTVPGDPKDITYVFFAMATGVICGINGGGHVWFVFVFFAVIAAVLILIEVLRYGICKTSSMTLKVTIPENLN